MLTNQNVSEYSTIPINYGGVLFGIVGLIITWYAAPSLRASEIYKAYFLVVASVMVLLGSFWHFRLDKNGITQLYFGVKHRRILWENVERVGTIYTTTYVRGNGQWHIVVIPKWCELPEPGKYNGLDYIRRNRKRIMKFHCNRNNIALIEKYYGAMDFDSRPK